MIHAVYHRDYHRLTIEGHAHSGEPGHDLVCASASILAYTLATAAESLRDNGQATDLVTDLHGGNAVVSCKPHHRFKAVASVIFDTVCIGFALLARDYPNFITYEVRG